MKTFALTLILAAAALAADRPANRQVTQQARIRQGVRSGQLTAPEARHLQARKNNLHQQIVRDRVDGGGLTLAERARIERQQDALSRAIARQKHDAQHR